MTANLFLLSRHAADDTTPILVALGVTYVIFVVIVGVVLVSKNVGAKRASEIEAWAKQSHWEFVHKPTNFPFTIGDFDLFESRKRWNLCEYFNLLHTQINDLEVFVFYYRAGHQVAVRGTQNKASAHMVAAFRASRLVHPGDLAPTTTAPIVGSVERRGDRLLFYRETRVVVEESQAAVQSFIADAFEVLDHSTQTEGTTLKN